MKGFLGKPVTRGRKETMERQDSKVLAHTHTYGRPEESHTHTHTHTYGRPEESHTHTWKARRVTARPGIVLILGARQLGLQRGNFFEGTKATCLCLNKNTGF